MNAAEGRRRPALGEAIIFRAKATALQIRRSITDPLRAQVGPFPIGGSMADEKIIAEYMAPLWTEKAASERHLVAGKIHNLRLAIRRLNGVEIPSEGIFSFWAQVGRAGRRRGYVEGRELRGGCLIPAIGGGLCQLSGALYAAALDAGFEIVERHAHTQAIPGAPAGKGMDATIFWNYVDLRFRSSAPFRIEASMTADTLIVRFRAAGNVRQATLPLLHVAEPARSGHAPESCASCGQRECFRHEAPRPGTSTVGRAAYLVDEYWPELDAYILASKQDHDLLSLPLDGVRFGRAGYAWSTAAFRHVRQRPLLTLIRSYHSRKLAAQGAARQRALLEASERLARGHAAALTPDVTHVVVTQQLLPFLWREGHLGGRTFDVLMTALPIGQLHECLDAAAALHPESGTLADFRAASDLLGAEAEALRHAGKIITPHSMIARLFPGRSVLLDWNLPIRRRRDRPEPSGAPVIVFPASTLGRKGAYELREALRGLDVELITVGAQLEGDDFWRGVRMRVGTWEEGLRHATAVVLPAFVEHRPRRLLEAAAMGIPVIASAPCGVDHIPDIITVPAGDAEALRGAIAMLPGTKNRAWEG